MADKHRLGQLCASGRLIWSDEEHGWLTREDAVVSALADLGYQEFKREVAWSRRDRRPVGGVWQGLDPVTGSVASVVWRSRGESPEAVAVLEIDGEPLEGLLRDAASQVA